MKNNKTKKLIKLMLSAEEKHPGILMTEFVERFLRNKTEVENGKINN